MKLRTFRVSLSGRLSADPNLLAKYFRARDEAEALRMAQVVLGMLPEGTTVQVEK